MSPVAPGEKTPILISDGVRQAAGVMGPEEAGNTLLSVEIIADAVQAEPAEAVTDARDEATVRSGRCAYYPGRSQLRGSYRRRRVMNLIFEESNYDSAGAGMCADHASCRLYTGFFDDGRSRWGGCLLYISAKARLKCRCSPAEWVCQSRYRRHC